MEKPHFQSMNHIKNLVETIKNLHCQFFHLQPDPSSQIYLFLEKSLHLGPPLPLALPFQLHLLFVHLQPDHYIQNIQPPLLVLLVLIVVHVHLFELHCFLHLQFHLVVVYFQLTVYLEPVVYIHLPAMHYLVGLVRLIQL